MLLAVLVKDSKEPTLKMQRSWLISRRKVYEHYTENSAKAAAPGK